jgi:hypothetical protein
MTRLTDYSWFDPTLVQPSGEYANNFIQIGGLDLGFIYSGQTTYTSA